MLGGAVRFWHDQLFCKPARHGGVVAWHQDYSYWTRTVPMNHLTCWIALDDAAVDRDIDELPGLGGDDEVRVHRPAQSPERPVPPAVRTGLLGVGRRRGAAGRRRGGVAHVRADGAERGARGEDSTDLRDLGCCHE